MMQTFLDGPLSYIRYKLWVMQMTWILLQEEPGETKELVVKRMYVFFRVCVCIFSFSYCTVPWIYGSKQTESKGIAQGQGLFSSSHKSLATCAITIIYPT